MVELSIQRCLQSQGACMQLSESRSESIEPSYRLAWVNVVGIVCETKTKRLYVCLRSDWLIERASLCVLCMRDLRKQRLITGPCPQQQCSFRQVSCVFWSLRSCSCYPSGQERPKMRHQNWTKMTRSVVLDLQDMSEWDMSSIVHPEHPHPEFPFEDACPEIWDTVSCGLQLSNSSCKGVPMPHKSSWSQAQDHGALSSLPGGTRCVTD